MKSKFLAIPLLVLPTTAIVATTVSCGDIFPKSIEIIGQNVVFIEQKDVQYEAKIDPDVLGRDIYWTVDDESVATIDQKGVLHLINPGTVTIRARTRSIISSVIGIKDVDVYYQPEDISIEGDQEAYVDRLTQYKATVSATKGDTAQDVIWFLTDTDGQELPEDTATIDAEGWLHPDPDFKLREDKDIIVNAKSLYNDDIVASKLVTITVPTPDSVFIDVSHKLTVGYDDEIKLRDNVLERTLEADWDCDDEYLDIEASGSEYSYKITPKKLTTETTIKGTSKLYSLSDEKKVEIVPPPESITITGKSQLHVGDVEPYTQRVLPSEAVQDVWWMFPLDHPEYSDYADINLETGVVTAKKATDQLEDKKITICAYSLVGEHFLIDPVAVGLFDIKILA